MLTWRRIDYDGPDMKGIEEEDLRQFFKKFGKIVQIEMMDNRAIITYNQCSEAEFCLTVPSIVIKNHSVWAKPFKPASKSDPISQENLTLVVKNLPPFTSESRLRDSFNGIQRLTLSKRTAFLTFYREQDAFKALESKEFEVEPYRQKKRSSGWVELEQPKVDDQEITERCWALK